LHYGGHSINGVNSYAKMVKQYRDRLLMAHAAASGENDENKSA
jgi:hypothetical protein